MSPVPQTRSTSLTKPEAARAALASARLEGQPVDAENEATLREWVAGRLPDTALRERAEEIKRQVRARGK